MIDKQTRKHIKSLRMYNGLKFFLDEFNSFCKLERSMIDHSFVGTPQQNGVVEDMKITIMEKVCYMLSTSELSKSY